MLRFAIAAALLLLALPATAQQSAFRASGPTVTLAASTTTARVQILPADVTTQHARIYNSGTVAAFVACGDVTVVATTAAGMPIAPGTVEVIGCTSHIAGITATGTATLYLTPGSGI